MHLHQEITLPASPRRIFDILTDSAEFAAATELPATLSAAEGEAFNLFGGNIEGRQVELASGERVVQAWRISAWDPGVYSLVRFTLLPEGDGTRMVLDQEGIPQGASPFFPTWEEHVTVGWSEYYFGRLQKYLA